MTDTLYTVCQEFSMSKYANQAHRSEALLLEIARLRDLLVTPEGSVRLELKIPEQLCKDFLTSCYEGASTFWLACDSVQRDEQSLDVLVIVGCCDAEDPDNQETQWGAASAATIRAGIQRILSGSVPVRDYIRGDVLAAVLDQDNANWDAETADTVLQAGLLGEITYG